MEQSAAQLPAPPRGDGGPGEAERAHPRILGVLRGRLGSGGGRREGGGGGIERRIRLDELEHAEPVDRRPVHGRTIAGPRSPGHGKGYGTPAPSPPGLTTAPAPRVPRMISSMRPYPLASSGSMK